MTKVNNIPKTDRNELCCPICRGDLHIEIASNKNAASKAFFLQLIGVTGNVRGTDLQVLGELTVIKLDPRKY